MSEIKEFLGQQKTPDNLGEVTFEHVDHRPAEDEVSSEIAKVVDEFAEEEHIALITFEETLYLLKEDTSAAARMGWTDEDTFIQIVSMRDSHCNDYIEYTCENGTHEPWVPTQSDILSDDWYIL